MAKNKYFLWYKQTYGEPKIGQLCRRVDTGTIEMYTEYHWREWCAWTTNNVPNVQPLVAIKAMLCSYDNIRKGDHVFCTITSEEFTVDCIYTDTTSNGIQVNMIGGQKDDSAISTHYVAKIIGEVITDGIILPEHTYIDESKFIFKTHTIKLK